MIGLILLVVPVALIIGGSCYWARRQRLVASGPAKDGLHARRRVSLLTDAMACVGAIQFLAGVAWRS